jgi:hypothetical protein
LPPPHQFFPLDEAQQTFSLVKETLAQELSNQAGCAHYGNARCLGKLPSASILTARNGKQSFRNILP